MTVLSFAQNREDVLLWRALSSADPATSWWVDIGAADPVHNSVTKWFSLQGWRGVNVDPVPLNYQALVADRPLDQNVLAAVGAANGRSLFSVVNDNAELSTLDPVLTAHYRSMGMNVEDVEIEVLTLVSVFDSYVPVDIDCAFLKIDVEGHEAAVIGSGDWERHRPWVIMVEATDPEQWTGLLASARYEFVLDDGLNFVFVAAEHVTALAPFLKRPVSSLDDHLLYRYSLGAAERTANAGRWAASFVASQLAFSATPPPIFLRLAELFVARVDLQRAFSPNGVLDRLGLLRWATTTSPDVDPEVRIFAGQHGQLHEALRL